MQIDYAIQVRTQKDVMESPDDHAYRLQRLRDLQHEQAVSLNTLRQERAIKVSEGRNQERSSTIFKLMKMGM